ncbi:MAG: signal peptidase II [Endomicrobia bacterium]|nr:signal peptidase II [Endomicrobiia bacterium]
MKFNLKDSKWFFLFLFLVGLDQYTKFLIRVNFRLYQTKQILPFLALTYTTNTGIVFGWFSGANIAFIVIVILVLMLVLLSAKSIISEIGSLGKFVVCLIISGGVGNLIDRIFLGEVIDFIDLQWNYKNIWPIFNLADSYVFIGVCMVVIKYIINEFKFLRNKRKDATNTF